MERTKKSKEQETTPVVDNRVWFKKIGGGSARLRINGVKRLIKPNEKFQALVEEIPVTQRDVIIRVDGTVMSTEKEAKLLKPVKLEYTLKQRSPKSTLWWDVIDKNGKVLNAQALPKDKAEQLIADLNK